ncbi:PRTRC system protein E [Herbaspirillum camelliae]|uniref:PRTRC system protein E n=1 Tax=Herbaspirillum camelliae TaxID=1892903 RepID=UPI000949E9C1|nr:PRTRC system protein E [Herbaspirillum camelliae]
MFKALQELASKSTLLISIAPEGDLMRVNITPVSKDPNTTPALRPLSLLASADELDRDFAQAMQMWSAPRRSLLDQVAAAAEQEDAEDSAATSTGSKAGGKESKPGKGAPKTGRQQNKSPEPSSAAKPDHTGEPQSADGAAKPQEQASQTSAPAIETEDAAASSPGPATTSKGASETIPAAALDKDWQTTPASNQPPPVSDSEAGKAASTPTPAAQSGGAFSDIEF